MLYHFCTFVSLVLSVAVVNAKVKNKLFSFQQPTHLATATHATIVAIALAIRLFASVTDLAVRNERNNSSNNNNVNVSYLCEEIIVNCVVFVSRLTYVYSFKVNNSIVTYNPYRRCFNRRTHNITLTKCFRQNLVRKFC